VSGSLMNSVSSFMALSVPAAARVPVAAA
jgi:hypothetical protein